MFLSSRAKLAFLVCFIGLAVAGGWLVKQQFDIASARSDTCHREQSDRQVLRRLIVFFEGRTLSSPSITKKEKPQILVFYNAALAVVPTISCN